ncbi:hypothetical protein F4776DRAFT_620990 [Hypoxylon sp. NC0597]|nr:hypothetical protein F4776DRAFT_620990 [Hypoxylon sp. NC0597]
MHLKSWFSRFLENYVYARPEFPPRIRTKPMQVICIGFPRCGSESLRHALLRLGYHHTYNGWNNPRGKPDDAPRWVRLCRRKWFGRGIELFITRADFDAILGNAVAVMGPSGAAFASDLVTAYPEAKVILNYRRDTEAWHHSMEQTIARRNNSWTLWLLSWLSLDCFWFWQCHVRFMWLSLFEPSYALDPTDIDKSYRHHNYGMRRYVPEERLLEWTPEDGWGPLCEFLDKPIPAEPFPRTNTIAKWEAREAAMVRNFMMQAVKTLILVSAIMTGAWTMFSGICVDCP